MYRIINIIDGLNFFSKYESNSGIQQKIKKQKSIEKNNESYLFSHHPKIVIVDILTFPPDSFILHIPVFVCN